jgi:threonine dehydrogenase-like Zn-dependent dehydrogenase
MKAARWYGKHDVRVEEVPDPGIVNPHDAIIRVEASAICGSDLHLYDGYIPSMKEGDILGHEFAGEIVELGSGVTNLEIGDRVVVPFAIACGRCEYCQREQFSACDNTNPNAWMAEGLYGHAGAGLFGYSHMMGGYAGGQAQYVRVPFANVGCVRLDGVPYDKAIFLSDIFPTGYMAAENCDIQDGDIVAVWGCGPVGQFAIRSALMLGAERVIAIDDEPARLQMAQDGGAEIVELSEHVREQLDELTGGRGPDSCIEAVGMEAHGTGVMGLYDRAKQTMRLQTDRPTALRQAILACKKGGVVSIPGVFGGIVDKFPLGAAFGKGVTLRMGQTHVHRYMRPLLERILRDEIDPSFVITHRVAMDDMPDAYEMFRNHDDGCVKVLVEPNGHAHTHH